MNNLHRELAPVSGAAWASIEEEARRTFTLHLAGRRVADVRTPGDEALAAVGTGHIDAIGCLKHPAIALEYRNRAREILDLFAADGSEHGGQIGQLTADLGAALTPKGFDVDWPRLDEARWSFHPSSTPPRCGRHASRRSAWRWRARAPCRLWPWCWSCRPDGTARSTLPLPLCRHCSLETRYVMLQPLQP